MKNFLAKLDRWSDLISHRLYLVGVYGGLPALVILVSIDVALRYFLNSPIRWVRDVNGLLLMISLFSALPHAWDRGFHIRMELLHSKFTGRLRNISDVLSAICGVAFFALLTVQALRFVPYMAATRETGEDLMVPLWPFMAFMAACGAVFVARLVANPGGAPGHVVTEKAEEWI